MAQNDTKFRWTEKRIQAAQLLAADELTDEEIAGCVSMSRRQFNRLKVLPEFQERVQEFAEQLGAVALRYAIGRRARRLQALQERWEKMLQIIQERSEVPEMQNVPGGKSGLLVKTLRALGRSRVVEEYAVDTGLLKELREIEKQAAQETGQWADKKVLSGPDGQPAFKVLIGIDPEEV